MDLSNIVQGYITDSITQKIGEKVGLSPEVSKSMASKVLPLFMSKIAQNAEQDEKSAQSVFGAIEKDHDGSVFENLSGLLGGEKDQEGSKILSHVFGSQESTIEKSIAQTEGVESSQAQSFMKLLAPLVMGAMGKEQTANKLDLGSVVGMLSQFKSAQSGNKATNPLLALIDKDGDGVTDDLLKMGMSFLNKKA